MLPSSIFSAHKYATLSYNTRDHMSVPTDTQIVIRHEGTDTYIGFRGTTNIIDWFTNITFFEQEFPYWGRPKENVRFHSGYLVAYDSVRQYILDVIDERIAVLHDANIKQEPHIIPCGHSLGGAIALICGYDLAGIYPHQVTVHNWGAPRVANREACNKMRDDEMFSSDSTRSINFLDPVWRLPMWFHGLRHPCDNVMKKLFFWNVRCTIPFFIGQHDLAFYGENISSYV